MSQIAAFVQPYPAPVPVSRDKRKSPRRRTNREAVSRCLESADGLSWGATVQDISAGGIGLSLCYPFQLGTYLAIDLRTSQSQRTILGRVVHVQDQSDGTWFIGCEFVKQLHADEAEAMV